MDTWHIGLAASSWLLIKGMFDVFGHPLNGLWKSLYFFPHPSPLGLLLRLMAGPQIEVKQKPNHRAATSLYFFHGVLSPAFNGLSSESLAGGLFQVNARQSVCWRKRDSVCGRTTGVLPRCHPSNASQSKMPWSAWVGVLHSRDKEKEMVSKKLTGEESKLKLEL